MTTKTPEEELAKEVALLGLPPGATLEEIQLAKLHAAYPPPPQVYSEEFLRSMAERIGALE